MGLYNIRGELIPLGNKHTADWLKKTQYISHRGTSRYPQNTIVAFENNIKEGYKILECDVGFTSDNIPVLLHDETINNVARNDDGSRLTETIYISDITYEQALTYDFGIYFGDAQYAGTRIATLSEFLKLCKKNNVACYLDIVNEDSREKAAIIYDLIKSYGMTDSVILNTTKNGALRFIEMSKDLIFCIETINTSTAIDELKSIVGNSALTMGSVYFGSGAATSELIEYAHSKDVKLVAYTVNDETDANSLFDMTYDYVLTDTILPSEL